jgi:hypothetical protein
LRQGPCNGTSGATNRALPDTAQRPYSTGLCPSPLSGLFNRALSGTARRHDIARSLRAARFDVAVVNWRGAEGGDGAGRGWPDDAKVGHPLPEGADGPDSGKLPLRTPLRCTRRQSAYGPCRCDSSVSKYSPVQSVLSGAILNWLAYLGTTVTRAPKPSCWLLYGAYLYYTPKDVTIPVISAIVLTNLGVDLGANAVCHSVG